MADQQKQSGTSATLDSPSVPQSASNFPGEKYNATGSIEDAHEGSSVLIADENGDPIDTVWTGPNGSFFTKLPKGTYKVTARDLNNDNSQTKTLHFGNDGFEPLHFELQSHDDTSHKSHPYASRSEDTFNSQAIAQALSSTSQTTLTINEEFKEDSRYKAIVDQLTREQNSTNPPDNKALQEEAKKRFQAQYPQLVQFYDNRAKLPNEKRDARQFEQYEKQSKAAADQAVKNAYEVWKKGDRKTPFNTEEIYNHERYRMAAQFIELDSQRSSPMAKKDKYINGVYKYYEEQKQATNPPAESKNNDEIQDGPDTVKGVEKFLLENRSGTDIPKPSEPRNIPSTPESPTLNTPPLEATSQQWEETQKIIATTLNGQEAAAQEQEMLQQAQRMEQTQAFEQMQAAQQAQEEQQQAQLQQNAIQEENQPRPQSRVPKKYQRSMYQRGANSLRRLQASQQKLRNLLRYARFFTNTARLIPLLTNPITLTGIGITILIILVIIIFNFIVPFPTSTSTQNPEVTTEIPGLSLVFNGPKSGTPTSTLRYEINISYNPPLNSPIPIESITVYYKLQEGTQFVSSTGGSDIDDRTNTIFWRLSRPENRSGFSFIIQATRDNFKFTNDLYARVDPSNYGGGVIDAQKSLDDIFKESADRSKIPKAFLKAIAKKESQVLTYTDQDVVKFNTKDWFANKVDNAAKLEDNDRDIIRGFAYNTCQYSAGSCAAGSDVRGSMQFLLTTWDSSVKPKLSFSDHDPDRRYVRDAILGSGIYIKAMADQYESQYKFSQNPNDWTETQVKAMAATYCGGSPTADVKFDRACGTTINNIRIGYDEKVWEYYREFKLGEAH